MPLLSLWTFMTCSPLPIPLFKAGYRFDTPCCQCTNCSRHHFFCSWWCSSLLKKESGSYENDIYIAEEFVSVKQATSCMLWSCGKLLPDVEKMPFQLLLLPPPPKKKLCWFVCSELHYCYLFAVRWDIRMCMFKDVHAVPLYCRKELFEYCVCQYGD